MHILVIGGGGREHTLVWKLSQSEQVDKIYAIPGNPGMMQLAECIDTIDIMDNVSLVDFAKKQNIDLVVVGPEVPLINGAVDAFVAAGIKAFGPNQAAAEIEGSKSFSKNLMKKYGIPTAKYEVFTDVEKARAYIQKEGAPIVIKADGLAAGKGVIVAVSLEEALAAVNEIMCDQAFGKAGSRVVIEECLIGEEASLLAFTDGDTIVPMVSSQDHKRAYDNDEGPNTGGMGAYAPAPVVTAAILDKVQKEVLEPTIAAMKAEGRKYIGCLYAGIMITTAGPKVIEFNARFGDPETQVVLPLLKSDLVDVMLACIEGRLKATKVEWSDEKAVCVVMAAGGYPKSYKKEDVISGLAAAQASGAFVFHAGTASQGTQIVTNGGRVLGVVATAPDIKDAVAKAYLGVSKIDFANKHYRTDIAYRALNRLQ
ncbi:phosphoribosylamine--glycine ligase [Propionispira raffinosivorans]|uniref:phosphoribosylamine--glycine ligase n=1 Tax=Propionispira raffinosivorans TaxID=86959 RepID=UPI0003637875|nr:phosphoribosylamine--glycine ligase [Propionispira raffinosivorans]